MLSNESKLSNLAASHERKLENNGETLVISLVKIGMTKDQFNDKQFQELGFDLPLTFHRDTVLFKLSLVKKVGKADMELIP